MHDHMEMRVVFWKTSSWNEAVFYFYSFHMDANILNENEETKERS